MATIKVFYPVPDGEYCTVIKENKESLIGIDITHCPHRSGQYTHNGRTYVRCDLFHEYLLNEDPEKIYTQELGKDYQIHKCKKCKESTI